jgi:hypothetical protein
VLKKHIVMIAHEPGMPLCGTEVPTYLDRGGLQTYVVEHRPVQPWRAVVVLAGPMSLERANCSLSWVRWARTLACNGFLVVRFDYTGVGESTGSFAEQTFDTWAVDLGTVVRVARERHPDARLFVNGLRLGALLGQAVGDCDGLLAWDPPTNGRAMLADMLRRKLAGDYMDHVGERKTREEYIRELESGAVLEVEGYPWSRGLWSSADRHTFAPRGQHHVIYLDGRPAERLPDRQHGESLRIGSPPFWVQPRSLVSDLSELFQRSVARLEAWS